eukprot:353090-Chlamydomonas_euryale.AAC.1
MLAAHEHHGLKPTAAAAAACSSLRAAADGRRRAGKTAGETKVARGGLPGKAGKRSPGCFSPSSLRRGARDAAAHSPATHIRRM